MAIIQVLSAEHVLRDWTATCGGHAVTGLEVPGSARWFELDDVLASDGDEEQPHEGLGRMLSSARLRAMIRSKPGTASGLST